MVEPVACSVLTKSCFRVDAQQLVAVDHDSRMRRSLWISGANVNEEQYPQVLTRKFLDEEERRNICRHKSSFTGLISVYREDGVCCVFHLVAESRLVPTDSCDEHACCECDVFSSTATTESLHYLCIWNVITLVWCTGDFETEQVPLQYRGEVWFLLVLCTSCNVLFTTSLRDHSGGIYLCMNVSGDVCVTKLCLTVRCISLLHFLQSSRVFKHLRGANGFLFFLACSLSKLYPSGRDGWTSMIWTQQDYYRGSPRATMWNWSVVAARLMVCGVGHNEALDRTMSSIGKILIDPVNGKGISDIDGQSDRDDVANRVFLREIDVSAVPLLKTSYPQLESNFKRSDVQFCVQECARGVRDRVLQRATRICRYFLCSSLFGAIEEINLRCMPRECHVAFWTLIVILIQSGRTPTHPGSRRPSSGKFRWASVRRRPLSLTRDRSLVWSLRSGQ